MPGSRRRSVRSSNEGVLRRGTSERRERNPGRDGLRQPAGRSRVASARNGAYGDSVARLLEFAGHRVELEYYYNDSGTQMEKFRALGRGRGGAGGAPEDG